MKNFYNQEETKIIQVDKFKEIVFNLDIPSTYGFSYYERLDQDIQEFFKKIRRTDKPTLFKIIGDFYLIKEADKEEFFYFLMATINIFVGHTITKKELEREQRLAVPKILDKYSLSSMTKKDLVNKEILFPNFALEVWDSEGKKLIEVFSDEDISINFD